MSTKYDRAKESMEKFKEATKGEGLYLFQNHTNADLMLPKATSSGVTKVPKGGHFQGDSYFMGLVRSGQCRLIKEIASPKTLNEASEQKLILDQPNVVKSEGKVEYVQTKIVETPAVDKNEKLINENPIDGVDIILE